MHPSVRAMGQLCYPLDVKTRLFTEPRGPEPRGQVSPFTLLPYRSRDLGPRDQAHLIPSTGGIPSRKPGLRGRAVRSPDRSSAGAFGKAQAR
jgi:hypothetical protein